MTTTPNEFLEFAEEMGLGQIKSTNITSTTNGYSSTGLSVLNNLCYLIEQIHTLKSENDHLRSHLELVKQVEQFISTKTIESRTLTNNDEEISSTLSPSSSLKNKIHQSSTTLSTSSRERQGVDLFINNPDESSLTMHLENDINEQNFNSSSWNRVRHALKFSLRRKPHVSTNSSLTVPAISISVDSDDDRLQEHNHSFKQKKIMINQHHDETDDESYELNRLDEKRQLYRTNRANSSSNDNNLPVISIINDEDNLSSTKPSKIAHYRRKLRSKLSTVRKQFSEQNSSLSLRHQLSPFDDLNAKLAPAMTKSYQQKMRDWQTMQKSHFLVNYRRQSMVPKPSDLPLNGFSTLLLPTQSEKSISSVLSPELEKNLSYLNPILSPNQRSLIAHQWREIMSEEISLRHYNQYFQQKLQQLKQLETNLKFLKTSIFCTKNQANSTKQRSMSNVESFDHEILEQYRENSLQRRCQSLQTFVSMPASWILAVQSAAYSDILDGTSMKTTDRAIIFNRKFFDQLNHFKLDRINFQRETFKDFHLKIEEDSNVKRSTICSRPRILLTRGHLRKLPLISPNEFSFPVPQTPCQILTPKSETSSHIDLLNPTENDSHLLTSSSASTLNKRLKRSRFDFKKTLQRSKSICVTQFQSWFQRRRQQQQQYSEQPPRRKSAIESKLLGSPRLARLHQRIFKIHHSSSPPPPPPPPPSLTPLSDIHLLSTSTTPSLSQISDDSDRSFRKQESPVRIYLPARPSSVSRHLQIANHTEIPNLPSMPKITSPIINRRNLSSTGQERRDSFVTLSSINNNNNQ